MQAASRGGNGSEICCRCARPCSPLTSHAVNLGAFICCDEKQKVTYLPLLAGRRAEFQPANVSLSLLHWKCQTIVFQANQMDEQKCHSAPPHTHTLTWAMVLVGESWLRHFGSSIQQTAKRNLLFKPLLVKRVRLMWQLVTRSPPYICQSNVMWPRRQYGSRLDESRAAPDQTCQHVFQTRGEISFYDLITEADLQLLQSRWRWSSSQEGSSSFPLSSRKVTMLSSARWFPPLAGAPFKEQTDLQQVWEQNT